MSAQPVLLDVPPVPATLRQAGRAGIQDFCATIIGSIRAGLFSHEEMREALLEAGVTPRVWAQTLSDLIAEGQPARVRMRAVECVMKFYTTRPEDVALLKVCLDYERNAPPEPSQDHLHVHTQDPEHARLLSAATQDPEVSAALHRFLDRQAEGGRN